MCVLTSAYAKDLCLLPALLAIAFPVQDQLAVGFAAFVVIGIFKIVARLASFGK
jgi:hypothetical protein